MRDLHTALRTHNVSRRRAYTRLGRARKAILTNAAEITGLLCARRGGEPQETSFARRRCLVGAVRFLETRTTQQRPLTQLSILHLESRALYTTDWALEAGYRRLAGTIANCGRHF